MFFLTAGERHVDAGAHTSPSFYEQFGAAVIPPRLRSAVAARKKLSTQRITMINMFSAASGDRQRLRGAGSGP